jgi:hypothetical protein
VWCSVSFGFEAGSEQEQSVDGQDKELAHMLYISEIIRLLGESAGQI